MDLPSPGRGDALSADGERVRFPTPGWTMTLLALAGAVVLIAGVAAETQFAIVLGAILFGIGAQWLVIRTAVTSALRGERREREDE